MEHLSGVWHHVHHGTTALLSHVSRLTCAQTPQAATLWHGARRRAMAAVEDAAFSGVARS
eukprot:scaffold27837_cov133-Isochrysis_galbana.AAC.4